MEKINNFAKAFDFKKDVFQSLCDKHGMTEFMQVTILGEKKNPVCSQCVEESKNAEEQERKRAAELHRKNALIARLADNGIDANGKDFTDWVYDKSQEDRQQKMIAALQRYSGGFNKDLPNILLIGGTGSGKTMLANAIARDVFDGRFKHPITSQGFVKRSFSELNPAHLVRSAEIIRQIKSTWSYESPVKEDDLISKWTAHDLLIIDDLGDGDAIGKEQTAADDRNRISQLINLRYKNAPTIITTNMNQQEVAEFLGDRAWDRLQEKLVIIKCDWASFRQQTAKVSYL